MGKFILIVIAILIVAIISVSVLLFLVWSAKKTLLKGETAWSSKNIPIKRNKVSRNIDRGSSLLETISEETNQYLGGQEKNN
tara:strand:- start:33 stop:278 length:246 start_codon:yes stop_codon:yes gene_type:complete